MSTPTVSGLTPSQEQIVFTSIIAAGLQEAYLGDLSLVYDKIARCQMPEYFAQKFPGIFRPDGQLINPGSAALPDQAVFGQVMPLARMEALSPNGGGATSFPLMRQAQNVLLGPYEAKAHESVWNFRKDVFGTLQAAAGLMRRTAEKNADFLLAALLQNGNTSSCWHTALTGKNFFDTNIPCDLGPNLSGDTFTNYYTNTPLTSTNILKKIGYARSIRLGDRVPISVNLDTLIYPTVLENDAQISTMLRYIVYSGAGVPNGNLAPGQSAGTAAMGENAIQLLNYVKKVVPYDVLSDGTSSGDVTWYLADSRMFGLLYARALAPQYAWQVDPNSAAVFEENEYRFKVNTWEGAAYGLPQFIFKMRGN